MIHYSSSLKINPYKLRMLVVKSGKYMQDISNDVGKTGGWLSNVICQGSITIGNAQLLQEIEGFDPYDYIEDDNIDTIFGTGNVQNLSYPQKRDVPVPTSDDSRTKDDFVMLLKAINSEIGSFIKTIEGGRA